MCSHVDLGKLPLLLPDKYILFSTKTLLTCEREKFPTRNSYFNSSSETF